MKKPEHVTQLHGCQQGIMAEVTESDFALYRRECMSTDMIPSIQKPFILISVRSPCTSSSCMSNKQSGGQRGPDRCSSGTVTCILCKRVTVGVMYKLNTSPLHFLGGGKQIPEGQLGASSQTLN